MINDILCFLNTNSGAITTIATGILVIITGFYVRYTYKLSKTTQDQFNLQRQQYLTENRPWIFITSFSRTAYNVIFCKIENCGKLPAIVTDFKLKFSYNEQIIEEMSAKMQSSVIFPGKNRISKEMFFDRNKMNYLGDNSEEYVLEIEIKYFSIIDSEKENEHLYSIKCLVRNLVQYEDSITIICSHAE